MAENNFDNVVDSLMDGMNHLLSSKTVIGEATKLPDGTMILPLVDVSFGVGAGSNSQDKAKKGLGGFGAKMSPSAVLVIKNGSTKLVNVKNQDAVTKILDLVPDVVDKFTASKQNMPSDEEAVDAAFGEEL
ncbi:GerW family sporulation protein [Butyrivibrio sp. MC2013]|uniref:GerW family sporulation protein n=1 Tax=Butyrivibrio sp. MC2013 TaxID=1280686 RepID=UPI0004792DB3|nr:GerW family sporulation protein [Butyrivibrio sp. MC2013]